MSKRYPKNYISMIGFVLLAVLLVMAIAPPVTARAAAPEIKLNVKTKVLVTEKTYPLKLYNLSDTQTANYKSDHPEIASVDEMGIVTAVSVGTAMITVTVKEFAKPVAQLQCEITVGPPAISVKLTQPTVFLMNGRKAILKTILQPFNTAENAKFSSMNPLIAGVNSSGRITARSLGTTYIFAAIDNGKYDLCKVIIIDEETYLALLENPDVDPLTLIPLEIEEEPVEEAAPVITEALPSNEDETIGREETPLSVSDPSGVSNTTLNVPSTDNLVTPVPVDVTAANTTSDSVLTNE